MTIGDEGGKGALADSYTQLVYVSDEQKSCFTTAAAANKNKKKKFPSDKDCAASFKFKFCDFCTVDSSSSLLLSIVEMDRNRQSSFLDVKSLKMGSIEITFMLFNAIPHVGSVFIFFFV